MFGVYKSTRTGCRSAKLLAGNLALAFAVASPFAAPPACAPATGPRHLVTALLWGQGGIGRRCQIGRRPQRGSEAAHPVSTPSDAGRRQILASCQTRRPSRGRRVRIELARSLGEGRSLARTHGDQAGRIPAKMGSRRSGARLPESAPLCPLQSSEPYRAVAGQICRYCARILRRPRAQAEQSLVLAGSWRSAPRHRRRQPEHWEMARGIMQDAAATSRRMARCNRRSSAKAARSTIMPSR